MRSRVRRWSALALALVLLAAPFSAHATISGAVNVTVNLQDARTSGSEQTTQHITRSYAWNVTHGTGAGAFNLCWPSTRTLTTGANEDIDVSGSLTNAFGTAVFTAVKLIFIEAATANTTTLTVTRPAANSLPFLVAASDGFALTGGDVMLLTRKTAAGFAVTAGTADLINVANSAGASATYTVFICGLS